MTMLVDLGTVFLLMLLVAYMLWLAAMPDCESQEPHHRSSDE